MDVRTYLLFSGKLEQLAIKINLRILQKEDL